MQELRGVTLDTRIKEYPKVLEIHSRVLRVCREAAADGKLGVDVDLGKVSDYDIKTVACLFKSEGLIVSIDGKILLLNWS